MQIFEQCEKKTQSNSNMVSRIQKWVFRTFLPMQSRKEEENDELIAVYI